MGPETGSPGETFAIPFNDGSRSSCDAMVLTASYQDDFEQFYRGDIGQVETVYGGSSEGGQDTGPSEPPDPWKKKKKHKSNEWDKPDNKNHGHHRSRDKHHDHHRKHRHRSDDDYDDHHHHRRHRHRPCSIL